MAPKYSCYTVIFPDHLKVGRLFKEADFFGDRWSGVIGRESVVSGRWWVVSVLILCIIIMIVVIIMFIMYVGGFLIQRK